MKVLHYINQFFGGIGGEDRADMGLETSPGAIGPGRLLAQLLEAGGVETEFVTAMAGDTYAAENLAELVPGFVDLVHREQPDVVVAGPAFNAGRYGLVCGELAAAVPSATGVPALTGLYEESPAVGLFRTKALILRTGPSAAAMRPAMEQIARLLPRLAAGEAIEDREAEGLYGTGARRNVLDERPTADRAVDLLLRLLAGEDVGTELSIPDFDPVVPPPPVLDLAAATIALVTEGGLVPAGNPDHLSTGSSERWGRYPVADLLAHPEGFLSIHGGYDTRHVNESPFRMVPADAVAALVGEGVIGALHPYYYVTSGTATKVANCRMMGSQIAEVLRNEGVDAVIFTST